ncbi:MAG: hypothetical protein ACOY82_07575 [Pseudomonadota bacterium]
MHEVAHHLQVEALPKAGTIEGDRYGRSAFNRYYYATFLIVRQGISSMDKKWNKQDHAGIPGLLTGQVTAALKLGKTAAARQRDSELVTLCNRATAAASELSKLLEKANEARKIADYNPEVPIEFRGADRFSLSGIDINTAHAWAPRAKILVDTIVDAWRQVHV